MGVERGGTEHEAAIDRILKAAKGAGKTAAFFCKCGDKLIGSLTPDARDKACMYNCVHMGAVLTISGGVGTNGAEAKRRVEQGFEMVSIITDVNVIGDGIMRELGAAKGVDSQGGKSGTY